MLSRSRLFTTVQHVHGRRPNGLLGVIGVTQNAVQLYWKFFEVSGSSTCCRNGRHTGACSEAEEEEVCD